MTISSFLVLVIILSLVPAAPILSQQAPVAEKLELALQGGHSDTVCAFGYSADGSWLVSSGMDKTVRIWRTSDQSCFKTIDGFGDSQAKIAVSPDGTCFAMSAWSEEEGAEILRIYSIPRGAILKEIRSPNSNFMAIAFSPDGKRVLGGTRDGDLTEYYVARGSVSVRTAGHGDAIADCAYHPDGKSFVCVVQDFNATYGKAKKGDAGVDPCVKVWDAASGRLLRRATLPGRVRSCLLSPDGSMLAVFAEDAKDRSGELLLFRYSDLSLVARVAGIDEGYCFVPGGDRLFVSVKDGKQIQFWDPATGTLSPFASFRLPFKRLALVPGCGRLAIAAGNIAIIGEHRQTVSVTELDPKTGSEAKSFTGTL